MSRTAGANNGPVGRPGKIAGAPGRRSPGGWGHCEGGVGCALGRIDNFAPRSCSQCARLAPRPESHSISATADSRPGVHPPSFHTAQRLRQTSLMLWAQLPRDGSSQDLLLHPGPSWNLGRVRRGVPDAPPAECARSARYAICHLAAIGGQQHPERRPQGARLNSRGGASGTPNRNASEANSPRPARS